MRNASGIFVLHLGFFEHVESFPQFWGLYKCVHLDFWLKMASSECDISDAMFLISMKEIDENI